MLSEMRIRTPLRFCKGSKGLPLFELVLKISQLSWIEIVIIIIVIIYSYLNYHEKENLEVIYNFLSFIKRWCTYTKSFYCFLTLTKIEYLRQFTLPDFLCIYIHDLLVWFYFNNIQKKNFCGRHTHLMVIICASLRGTLCCVLRQDTLIITLTVLSFLHPSGYRQIYCWRVALRWTGIPSRGK